MAYKTIVEDGIDILIVGAGLGGSGAAWEARFWGQNKNIVIAEKANIDRCGAVAQGAGCKAVGRLVGHHQSPLPPRGLCLYGVMAAADVLA